MNSVPFFNKMFVDLQQFMNSKKFSLPNRIKKRKDFLRAASNGRKFHASSLLLQVVPSAKSNFLRIGFTTTKKLGKAVIRNRIRRRLKEAVRLYFSPKAPKGYDCVFIGRAATNEKPFGFLKNDVIYVLKQFLEWHNKTTLFCDSEVKDEKEK